LLNASEARSGTSTKLNVAQSIKWIPFGCNGPTRTFISLRALASTVGLNF